MLTTHYLDEAEQLADRIGVINHGRLIAEGSPQDIGGPGLRVPRVRWRDASGLREVVTEQPAALVNSLSDGGATEPAELAVVRPSLEDIYLQLIGAAERPGPTERSRPVPPRLHPPQQEPSDEHNIPTVAHRSRPPGLAAISPAPGMLAGSCWRSSYLTGMCYPSSWCCFSRS